MTTREAVLVRTFVELADTLVDSFDVIDMLTLVVDRCVDVLKVGGAGILLADPDDGLKLTASSDPVVHQIETLALETRQGPCFDCYDQRQAVHVTDLEGKAADWPDFVASARAHGFMSVICLPMRLRGTGVGTLSLFSDATLSDGDAEIAQAFADIAAISLLQHRVSNQQHQVNEQLQVALDSRVKIEQAKGILAERERIGLDDAFGELRNYARAHGLKLVEVAENVVNGTLVSTH